MKLNYKSRCHSQAVTYLQEHGQAPRSEHNSSICSVLHKDVGWRSLRLHDASLGEPRWDSFNQIKPLVEADFPHFGKIKLLEMAERWFKFNREVLKRSNQANFMFSTSI